MSRIQSLQPSRVLAKLGLLDWPAMAVGLEKGFVNGDDVVQRAVAEANAHPMSDDADPPHDVQQLLELSAAQATDSQVPTLVSALAGEMSPEYEELKWYFGLVTALYELNSPLEETIQAMDDVYAEAGWPEALRALGQYNDVHRDDDAEQRMLAKRHALHELRARLQQRLRMRVVR